MRRITTTICFFAVFWGFATIVGISFADSAAQLPMLLFLLVGALVMSGLYATSLRRRANPTYSRASTGTINSPPAMAPIRPSSRSSRELVLYPILMLEERLEPFSTWRDPLVEFQSDHEESFCGAVVNAYQLYLVAEHADDWLDGWSSAQVREVFLDNLSDESASIYITLCRLLTESIGPNGKDDLIVQQIPLDHLLAIDMLEDHPASPCFRRQRDEESMKADFNYQGIDNRLALCLSHARDQTSAFVGELSQVRETTT